MPRVSEKALRPRQYVLNRLSAERSKKLRKGVKELLEMEKLEEIAARGRVQELKGIEAARHAENIMAGKKEADPENDQIRSLEKELEELRQKRLSLFATLKEALDTDTVAEKEDVHMEDVGKEEEGSREKKSEESQASGAT